MPISVNDAWVALVVYGSNFSWRQKYVTFDWCIVSQYQKYRIGLKEARYELK